MATPNRQSSRQQTPGLLTHLRQSIHSHRLKLSVVTGKVKATQNDMTLLLTGSNHDKAYFKNLIFGDNCTEKSVHTVWQWALERFIRKQNADLLVAVNPGTAIDPYLRNRTPFISPMWVRGELDFDVTSACQKKISIKADLSKIRKNNLSYIVTKDPRLFDYFYHEMHVPHASNAHGKAALPIAYGEMKQLMHSADLFLVKKDDEFIAGGIIAYVNGKPRAWANGVKDGNPDYVKMGALSALYYFNFLHLEKKGFKSIHIGSSKPFLNDGVLQYKKKWGMRLTGTRGGVFAIDILKLSDGTKSFLVNNPFIQLCDNKLTGGLFS